MPVINLFCGRAQREPETQEETNYWNGRGISVMKRSLSSMVVISLIVAGVLASCGVPIVAGLVIGAGIGGVITGIYIVGSFPNMRENESVDPKESVTQLEQAHMRGLKRQENNLHQRIDSLKENIGHLKASYQLLYHSKTEEDGEEIEDDLQAINEALKKSGQTLDETQNKLAEVETKLEPSVFYKKFRENEREVYLRLTYLTSYGSQLGYSTQLLEKMRRRLAPSLPSIGFKRPVYSEDESALEEVLKRALKAYKKSAPNRFSPERREASEAYFRLLTEFLNRRQIDLTKLIVGLKDREALLKQKQELRLVRKEIKEAREDLRDVEEMLSSVELTRAK